VTPHDPLTIVLTFSLLVNWRLYAQLVQVCITLFNTVSLLVQSLLEVQGGQDPLPAFDCPQLEGSEYVPSFVPISTISNDHPKRSTFDDVNEWLSHWISRDDARMVAMDLQSHRNIGQGL
jgi:nuclear mRNA export protein SAC3